MREKSECVRGWRVCVVNGNEFRLAGLAGTLRSPLNIPGVSACVCVCVCVALPFSPIAHTHTHTLIVLPPHWLQHYDVTSRLIGCEAAEGRRGEML